MNWGEFAKWGHRVVDWGADYHGRLRELPVRAQVQPGEVTSQLPAAPPEQPEDMAQILGDFDRIIMPGITHWQHPRFFAYFPANITPPSVLAEYLASVVGAQCMLWQTSPAATELETRVLDWLRQAADLPSGLAGVIQGSASEATLVSVLIMRERAIGWGGRAGGLAESLPLRIYTSPEAHSSVDRAVRIAGIGQNNLVVVPVKGALRGMKHGGLQAAIARDRKGGFIPAGIVASIGGTSTGACDDLVAISRIAQSENVFLHVDAAWAGMAMICPENRPIWAGVEHADSIVMNPHKWLGAQFDCSAHFVREPQDLKRTLAMDATYLETQGASEVIDYSNWSIPLGRRFRALKLWFVLRSYGLAGLRQVVRDHVRWSQALARRLSGHEAFEIVTEPVLSLFTFCIKGKGDDEQRAFIERVNADGRIYVTQSRVDGRIVCRFQVGSFACSEADVHLAGDVLIELAPR